MYRCVLPLALVASCMSAHAQTHRNFPATALCGELVVTQFPDVLLNDQQARLAPGARIKSDTNLGVSPASITGQKYLVNYTVEAGGLLMDVGILNPVEVANKRWPRTPAEASSWQFDLASQTWSKP